MSQSTPPVLPPISSTPPVPVASAVPPEPDHLPHDIQELFFYPLSFGDWPAWALMVGALALLVFLGRWWWKRCKKRNVVLPEDPLLVSVRWLQNLTPPHPFEGKVQQEYFFQLNQGLRRHLELTCGFPAQEMTLRELRRSIEALPQFTEERKQEWIRFLSRSDLIKFAKAPTSLQEAQESHERVLGWLKWWNQQLKQEAQ